MSSPFQILNSYGILPKRSRGQNFLIDQNIVRKICEKAELKATDRVVEIGSGFGVLTRELAPRVKKVFAVDIDETLLGILQKELGSQKNLEIIKEDARKIPLTRFGKKDFSYRVIANIPYNLTSLLIQKFLEKTPRPSDMILMIQREVGERICAKPPDMSILGLITQYYAEPKVLFPVSKTCFFPSPQVDSVCIRLRLHTERSPKTPEAQGFTRLIKAGFAAKRKYLAKNISKGLGIPLDTVSHAFTRLEIPLKARAQELRLEQWIIVSKVIEA